MADQADMVCMSGAYKGYKIDLCVDQAEYTNRRRNQAEAAHANAVPGGGVVFPKSRGGFDGLEHPLVDVPGRTTSLGDGKAMLGAQELCGLEAVERNGKWYRKRLLTPIEWEAFASNFGNQNYSTRSGKLDEGVHYNADGTRAVGQAKGYYVEYGGKEVFDMNGNVNEWTYDPAVDKFYISGGSWLREDSWFIRADDRIEFRYEFLHSYIGLRCGVSFRDPPIKKK